MIQSMIYVLVMLFPAVGLISGFSAAVIETTSRIKQNLKFKNWIPRDRVNRNRDRTKATPIFLTDYVINLSSIELDVDEINLLNKGLNFALPPTKPPVEDICVDVISSVQKKPAEIREDIENNSLRIMSKLMRDKPSQRDKRATKLHKIVKSLREKNLIISKADKSNNVMVMDSSYYERVVMKTIANGPYEEMDFHPLETMSKEVNDVLEKHKNVLCTNPKYELRKWKVSNPKVPCLYVLLKIHKEKDEDGDYKGRPVASNVNAPSEKIAKKLSKIFNSLTPPEGKSVTNGIDFAKKVNGVKISRNEEIGSYDVTSLYPSIPINYSMQLLRQWLIKNKVSDELVEAYVDLAHLCMKQNIFQFRNVFYRQTKGTSIGNSLSSFIAELFMCDFETSMAKNQNFPRIYHRYVDDIFVVQNKRKFDLVKSLFEDKLDKIEKDAVKFTIERQVDNKLPFLNTMVEIVNESLTIDVYRKPSSTKRLIPCDSFHDIKHKMAAYHSMAHHMVNLPLSEEKTKKEIQNIIEIGKINGYPEQMIKCIIKKHQRKKVLRNISTFYENNKPDETVIRVGIKNYPKVTNQLKPIYQKHNIELVHRNDSSLGNALGSIKDVPPDIMKSGIYRVQCQTCGMYYFGRSIRSIMARFGEHQKSAHWKQKTAVGKHIFDTSHEVSILNVKLIQEVRRLWNIDIYEAIHIKKNSHLTLLNADHGNITSPLLKLFATKRKVDLNVIDLTDDTPNLSVNDEEFFDCE